MPTRSRPRRPPFPRSAPPHARRTVPAARKLGCLCPNDGFVEPAIPANTPEPRIDGLGPTPYTYDVSLDIDGKAYTGTGTWSGEGTEYGGDAHLTFDPPLPAPR